MDHRKINPTVGFDSGQDSRLTVRFVFCQIYLLHLYVSVFVIDEESNLQFTVDASLG